MLNIDVMVFNLTSKWTLDWPMKHP